MLQLQWFPYNEALGTFPSGYRCLTFLFIDDCWVFLCSEGDKSNPRFGFYLNMFLTLNSNLLSEINFDVPYAPRDSRFFKKKKKDMIPNVVFSEFLIMYSFGDFKFVSLYF